MTEPDLSPVVPIDPHFTILILPTGGVHAEGAPVMETGSESDRVQEAQRMAQSQAVQLDRSVRVSVARPDGAVHAYLLTPGGAASPVARHPRRQPAEPVDLRWTDGMPDRYDLLELVRSADRAGQWHGARVAAERLTLQLQADLGEEHPHVALAVELQGYFALRARDWASAARSFSSAAAARYVLGSPAADTGKALDNAVSAWTRSRGQRGARRAGLALAHLLVRVAPVPRGRLAAVLDGLGEAAG